LKIFLDSMGGGAWPFLVGGVICLVNSVNERDLDLLNSSSNLWIRMKLLRGTLGRLPKEVRGNNRSVMPLDVLGRTRATLTCASRILLDRQVSLIFSKHVVLGLDYCNF
jgi:hypothetical protein